MDVQLSDTSDLVVVDDLGNSLMSVRSLPAQQIHGAIQPSTPFLAALHTLGVAAPGFRSALSGAAASGKGLRVAFSPETTALLSSGGLRLLESSNGTLPTAVNSAGRIVEQARIVGSAAAGGAVGGAVTSATAGALVMVALPIVIASAAAYAQHRQLERSLASIKAVVERIEERLEDADTGVCEAAEQFLALVEDSLVDGGLTDYMRLELASHRTAVEALYSARKRWVTRFKRNLEPGTRADRTGEVQRSRSAWVDAIADQVKGGKLEQELALYVRSLLSRSKLNVLVAVTLAEEGRGTAAMRLIDRTETELRAEFFDLHRRLVPLARIAPEPSLLHKLPGMGTALQRAHETVRLLVDHLNEHVLPTIPDPTNQREVHAILSPATVASLSAGLP